MSEMDNSNPYAAPGANVDVPPEAAPGLGNLIENGRAVDSGRGMAWLTEGFTMFSKAPGIWVLMALVFIIGFMILSVIPLGGLAVYFLMPVIIAGMLGACRKAELGEALDISMMFDGFKHKNMNQLLIVGGINLGGIILIGGIMLIMGGGAIFGAAMGGRAIGAAAVGMMLIGLLLALGLMVPLAMALWYAPALVLFHDQEAIPAVKQSFFGCLKNIVPFLIWGIVAMIAGVIASIPLGLGWLVLWPVLVCSLYISYKDIFCE